MLYSAYARIASTIRRYAQRLSRYPVLMAGLKASGVAALTAGIYQLSVSLYAPNVSLTQLLFLWSGISVGLTPLMAAVTVLGFWGGVLLHASVPPIKRAYQNIRRTIFSRKLFTFKQTSIELQSQKNGSKANMSKALIVWNPQEAFKNKFRQQADVQEQADDLIPKGFFARTAFFAKAVTANMFTGERILQFAKKYPYIAGGLLEFNKKAVDVLYNLIRDHKEKEALEIIELIPQESLHRLLSKRDEENYTLLYWAMKLNINVAEKLLTKLTHEQIFYHLVEIVGTTIDACPLFYEAFWSYEKNKSGERFYEMAIKNWPDALKAKLLLHKDNIGDSLLMHLISRGRINELMIFLKTLSKNQAKDIFSGTCKHGLSPLVEIISVAMLDKLKLILSILPEQDWKDIFAIKPVGWSLTIGEKSMVVAHVRERKKAMKIKTLRGVKREIVPFLESAYNLQLPSAYKNYSGKEFEQVLNEIYKKNWFGCNALELFIKEHKQNPFDMLEQDTYLPPKTYTKAFHQLQLKYHPDRNKTLEAEEKSRLVNSAHAFIQDGDVRQRYVAAAK